MSLIKNFMIKKNGIMFSAVILITIVFSIFIPSFFSLANFKSVLLTMGLTCIMGLGVTFVLTMGEIDVSLGAMLSVAPVILAVLYTAGVPITIAFAIGAVVTIAMGVLNGILVSVVKMPSFISTLGVSGICQGLVRIVSNNSPIMFKDNVIINIFGKELYTIPKLIIWMIIMIVVAYILLHKTKLGRYIQCIGDNKEMAFLSGIPIKRMIIWSFVTCSIFVMMAGLVELGRAGYASPGIGEPLVLNAIVAAVIGGTSVTGGKGSIIGTFIGASFLAIVENGLFMLGFSPWVSNITIGIVIISVLTVNGIIEIRRKEIEHK